MQDDAIERVRELARYGRVRLTHHAQLRCSQRGIRPRALVAFLGHARIGPDPKSTDLWWARGSLAGRRLRVVFTVADEPVGVVLVITAMWEDADD